MGKALFVNGGHTGAAYGNGANFLVFGFISTGGADTYQIGLAGVISKLSMYFNATGASRTATLTINGSPGTSVVTATDSTAGIYTDASNSDSIAANDAVYLEMAEVGTNPSVYSGWGIFEATSGHGTFYATAWGLALNDESVTRYIMCGGAHIENTGSATLNSQLVRVAGTISDFQGYFSANARTTDTVFATNVAGSAGSGTFTVTASTTGHFIDTSNTDSVADGNQFCYQYTTGTGTETITPAWLGCSFTASSGATADIWGGLGSGFSRSFSATVNYGGFGRTANTTLTTEDEAEITPNFTLTATRLRAYISAHTLSGGTAATIRFRKNANNGNQLLTITGTGQFEDATNSDSVAATDTINYSVVDDHTAGAFVTRALAVTIADASSAGGGWWRRSSDFTGGVGKNMTGGLYG